MNFLNKPLNQIRFRLPKISWLKRQASEKKIFFICLLSIIITILFLFLNSHLKTIPSKTELEVAGFKFNVDLIDLEKFSNDLSRLSRELGYFEGQKDALIQKIRIKKNEDSSWVWIQTPWDETDSDHSLDHLKYYPQDGIQGSIKKILEAEGLLKK